MRAVDLDAMTPKQLLQILIDQVNHQDLEINSAEDAGRFFQTHKCDLVPLPISSEDEWDEWITSFEKGEKRVIYSLLQWILTNSDHLSKRCYLEPFCSPIDVPTEFLSSDNHGDLYDMYEGYKELQHDFVEIHKAFESLKESKALTISEMATEIDKADREKQQLLQRDQRMVKNDPEFQQLLSLTSTLRKEQARQLALEQQRIEQLQHAESAEKRLQEESRVWSALSNNQNSIDECIDELEKERQEAILKLETELIPKRLQLEAVAANAEVSSKSEDGIECLEEVHFHLNQKRLQIADEGHDKDVVGLLEQVDALCATKQDVDKKSEMNSVYATENQRLRDALEKKGTEMNFEELQSSLQEKIELYETRKEEIAATQQNLLELEGKKENLTKSLRAVEQTLKQEEEKCEITGYREVSKQLGNTFQETCILNERKSDTLDEMSALVEKIALTLDEKKDTLEPMIAKLKQERAVFQQMRDEHNIYKSRYEELQRQLVDENKTLEDRFSQMQKECEERESLYKLLITTDSITASTLEQKLEEVAHEEEPSFPSVSNLSQLYEDKIYRLQQLRNDLSEKHQDKNVDYNSKQDAMFQGLKKLLTMKHRSLLTDSSKKQ